MKKYLFVILFVCVWLVVFAGNDSTPTVNNTSIKANIYGPKIAVADGYYVYWSGNNNNNPILESKDAAAGSYIISDYCQSIGWASRMSFVINSFSKVNLTLYDDFKVRLNATVEYHDQGNGAILITVTGVRFTSGTLLASQEVSDIPDFSPWPESNCVRKRIKKLYAIPEQWLHNLQDTTNYVIQGNVDNDGSVVFGGSVAFLIADEIIDVNMVSGDENVIESYSKYTLSPVYRNLKFINPNGVHRFERISNRYPRNSVLLNREREMRTYASFKDGYGPHDSGNGGRISTNIDPRPIKNRLREDVPIVTNPGNFSSYGDGGMSLMGERDGDSEEYQVPVYLNQVDETTVYVYNLFGEGVSEANIIQMYEDEMMSFPVQAINQSSDYSVCVFTNTPSESDHIGAVTSDTISWGVTIPGNRDGLLDYYFDNNHLYYTDGDVFISRGDVNRDGAVSVSDVTSLVDALLDGACDDSETFSRIGADCNHDGEISIADIIFMIDYLLKDDW